jgi:hypothetical protein
LADDDKDWIVTFDKAVFDRSVQDKRFAYIVTLGRAVNAILFVHSVTTRPAEDSPAGKRDRFNSFLFGSAIMFECLNLIETMIATFSKDEMFDKGLRALLNDETAKQIKKAHLKGVRHQAVFHFDAVAFGKALEKTGFYTCSFVTGRGEPRYGLNYELADIIAAEILVGLPSDTKEFMPALGNAMAKTSDLINKFIRDAELFIIHHVGQWGYRRKEL